MASKPRRLVVDPTEVMVYHCYNTCARQAFHLTDDAKSSERLEWLRSTEEILASLFAIEVCFHAELDNVFHLVVRSRPDVVERMSDEEVVRRWLKIAKLKCCGASEIEEPTSKRVRKEMKKRRRVKRLRKRLSHVSWFVGSLSENLSRRINRADGTRGTIWASRYQCDRLPDEASILIGGISVDLNLIRAGKAETPDESVNTSAYERIQAQRMATRMEATQQVVTQERPEAPGNGRLDGWLVELTMDRSRPTDAPERYRSSTGRRASDMGLLALSVSQYLQILEWTKNQLCSDKRRALCSSLETVLERMGLNGDLLVAAVVRATKSFAAVALDRYLAAAPT